MVHETEKSARRHINSWGITMKKLLLASVSLVAFGLINGAFAADASLPAKAAGCPNGGDPYKNYSCLDPYLGTDFLSRFIRGHST